MINPFKLYLDTITAAECKEKTGVSKQALHAWKTGKCTPKMKHLREFAKNNDPLDIIIYFAEHEARRNS